MTKTAQIRSSAREGGAQSRTRDAEDATNATAASGTRLAVRPARGTRAELPTLLEESLLLEGERATVVPGSSIEELARSMMGGIDDEWGATARRTPVVAPQLDDGWDAAPATDAESVEVRFEPMRVSERFALLAEITECYLERLRGRHAVLYVAVARRDLMGLVLDHWGGFVLSLVDGVTSVQQILDVAPMPEHDALEVLDQLRERGVIKIRLGSVRR
jgi:hypothetical protein